MGNSNLCLFSAYFVALLTGCSVGSDSPINPDPNRGDSSSNSNNSGAGPSSGSGSGAGSGFESGSRLKVASYAGEDGSQLPYGLFDSEIEQPCSVFTIGDDYRCLPQTIVAPVGWTSATCASTMVTLSTGGCASPVTVVSPVRVFTLAAGGSTYYVGTSNNCVAVAVPAEQNLCVFQNQLDPSDFVAMELVVE